MRALAIGLGIIFFLSCPRAFALDPGKVALDGALSAGGADTFHIPRGGFTTPGEEPLVNGRYAHLSGSVRFTYRTLRRQAFFVHGSFAMTGGVLLEAPSIYRDFGTAASRYRSARPGLGIRLGVRKLSVDVGIHAIFGASPEGRSLVLPAPHLHLEVLHYKSSKVLIRFGSSDGFASDATLLGVGFGVDRSRWRVSFHGGMGARVVGLLDGFQERFSLGFVQSRGALGFLLASAEGHVSITPRAGLGLRLQMLGRMPEATALLRVLLDHDAPPDRSARRTEPP